MNRLERFTDVTRNRNGLEPRPALVPDETCLHRSVVSEATSDFSKQRHHPVFPVKVPARSVSMSVGHLDPGQKTGNHRHAYEAVMFILSGHGHSVVEGQRFDWKAGDAVYTPPWCWHQHVADADCKVEYLTSTNMPALEAMGQTVMREEEG